MVHIEVTLNLVDGGLFHDQVEAIRKAVTEQINSRNLAAAQALHTVLVLAERGKLAFDTDTQPPTIAL